MKRTKWILVAEDDVLTADLTVLSLASTATVVVARNGSEVIDCVCRAGKFGSRESGYPSVVLLDLKMPLVDGFEVLRRIKSDPNLKAIPVVVFTSSREESDVSRCYQLGANAYVVKPVDFKCFRETIRQTCEFWTTYNETPDGYQIDEVDRRPAIEEARTL